MADLRPMEFGEILDGALRLFRRHFGLFFKLSLAVMWLPFAIGVYLKVRFAVTPGMGPQDVLAYYQSAMASLFLWGIIVLIAYVCASLLLTAGSVRIISDSFLGRDPQFSDVLAFAWSKVIPLFLVGIGKSLLLGLLMVVLVLVIAATGGVARVAGALAGLLVFVEFVAGIWFLFYIACAYAVTTPAVALENLPSALDSFGRSWELTRGARGRMFGLGFVAWFLITLLLPSIISVALGQMVLQFFPSWQVAVSIASSLIPLIVAPILPCVLTLAYYDLRVRREGFDLQLLSEQIGSV
jgi:hypothetical protein